MANMIATLSQCSCNMRNGRHIEILQFSSFINFILVLTSGVLPANSSCPSTCIHDSCECDANSLLCSSKGLSDLSSFEGCEKVYRIWLNNNNIQNVKEKDFSAFPDAQYINLASNQIANIEDGAFSEVSELTKLVLNGNKISDLPKLNIPKVTTLELSDNLISKLELTGQNLEELTLANCKLPTLKNVLASTPKLSTLDLSNNELKELNSEWFEMAKSLTILDMSHNKVETLNIDGDNLRNLLRLDLSYNNVLKDLDPDLFKSMPVLQALNLKGTLLVTPSDGPLFSHGTISSLFMASCELNKALPAAAFSELPQLELLDLSNNNLFGVEGLFVSSGVLRILDLSGNQIQSLTSETLAGTRALEELYLNKTALDSFNLSTIAHLSSLRVLDISHTRLACFCTEDHWLLESWTNETEIQFINTCTGSSCDWGDIITTTEREVKCWDAAGFCDKGEKCCSNGICAKKCSGVAIAALPLTLIIILGILVMEINKQPV